MLPATLALIILAIAHRRREPRQRARGDGCPGSFHFHNEDASG